jgi:acyl-lipid omega-6 desaturase (Delta-12 desaturase)
LTTYATPTSGEKKPVTGGNDTATPAPATKPAKRERPTWATALDPYSKPRVARSVLEIATSVVPFLALWVAMYLALDVSYLLVLALAVPTAGFLLRSFIIFHDCTHGSFLPSRRGNRWLGIFTGLFVFQPFENWRHDHWVHHGSAGDLDRRGQGDVPTLTVAEYQSRSWRGRLGYWLFRHPLVMFGLGPIYSLVVMPRFYASTATQAQRRSVIGTNIALAIIIGTICWLIGWQAFLLIEVPMVMLAGTAGVWLFYVQHQFEDVYWENSDGWSYADAALRGSSYLNLPKVLQFFSGNIGLHHVHHLSARIPNYNLQRAHDNNEIFHNVPQLSMWDGLRAVRFKLWDEDSRRLVSFAEARAAARNKRSRVGVPATER